MLIVYQILKICAYGIPNPKHVPIVNRMSYTLTKTRHFLLSFYLQKCSLSNPLFIIIVVNDESSVLAEMYHCFPSETIVFKITIKFDNSLRIIRSKSRKVTVENQFIIRLKNPRFLNLNLKRLKQIWKIGANHNLRKRNISLKLQLRYRKWIKTPQRIRSGGYSVPATKESSLFI